ncbi:DUF1116 domain-containing protein [Sphingomonas sp.]|uniref:oxamate carbamoyltransferase subunit AllG family protein n=1 Tax=Sphingomonas sp. TaxID=28214 RepID=UPI0025DAE4E6|nr:DUF1116 domain-containing protein [Sphingomonas sp.]
MTMNAAIDPVRAQAKPVLRGMRSLRDLVGGHSPLLLHAGPPYASPRQIPAPVLNSAVAATLAEGWTASAVEARQAILSGLIPLEPAQDHGVVTPLAFVVSPSIPLLRVEDDNSGLVRHAPLNDGPAPGALRFGASAENGVDRLRRLIAIGPDMARALDAPIALLPVMAAGLSGGDDLHGVVAATNAILRQRLARLLSGDAALYLAEADHFALNVVMAACAVLLADMASRTIRGIVRVGGNGVDVGWSVAGEDGWRRTPATTPVGPIGEDHRDRTPLPAIGDSMVIDASGFGAAALHKAPALRAQLIAHGAIPDPAPPANRGFVGTHALLPPDIRLGFALGEGGGEESDKEGYGHRLAAILAILDAGGDAGLIGRGISTATIAS